MHTPFEKPIGWSVGRYNGRDSPHAHLSRWVQAYDKQPMRMHMNSMMGNMITKHVLGGGKCMNDSSNWNDRMWKERVRRRLST